MNALYNKEILKLAASLPLHEPLEGDVIQVTKTSRICGSRITIDVVIKDGVVTGYTQEVKACALGQASSAIVASNVMGKTWADIAPIAGQVEALLKAGGPPPKGEWDDFKVFIPAREHTSRHSAIMLPFEALKEAFVETENKQ